MCVIETSSAGREYKVRDMAQADFGCARCADALDAIRSIRARWRGRRRGRSGHRASVAAIAMGAKDARVDDRARVGRARGSKMCFE